MFIDAGSKGAMELTPSMRRGMELLTVAYDYAREVQRDDWEFALEIQSLAAAGVNNSELRWLVCKGLVRHAEEKNSDGKKARAFQQAGDVTFSERSCFVLTKEGYDAFRQLVPRPLAYPLNGARSDYRPSRRLES